MLDSIRGFKERPASIECHESAIDVDSTVGGEWRGLAESGDALIVLEL
jgi:hypothetical protein